MFHSFSSPASGLVLALALFAAPSTAAAHAFEPKPVDVESYSENFTLISDLEDGTYVQIQLPITNVGMGDGHGGCRVLVVPRSGSPWTKLEKVGRDQWHVAEKGLVIGPCRIGASSKQTLVEAAVGGARLRFELDAVPRSHRAPDGLLRAGDKFFEYEMLVPWARVQAVLEPPGRPARKLSGYAFLDHSRSTSLPADIAKQWVRFRSLRDGESMLLLARLPPEGGAFRGWVWRQGEEAARPLSELRISRLSPDADEATGWRVEGRAGDYAFRITSDRQLYRYAPVEEYGFMGLMARAVVGNPVTRTYRATLAEPGSADTATGILEVQHGR